MKIVETPTEGKIKKGKTPSFHPKHNNLAGDDELTKQVWAWAKENQLRFDTQEQRQKYTDSGGIMDTADRMMRVALRRDKSSKQHRNTLSDVPSTMFHRQVSAVRANIKTILFRGDELPAEYESEVKLTDRQMEDGKYIAQQQNLLQQYTFDEDKRPKKIKKIIYYILKYGNQLIESRWDFREEEKTDKVPSSYFDKEKTRVKEYKFINKKKIVANHPTIIRHDMKDCWFDAQIEDMDLQRVVLIREQVAWENLLSDLDSNSIMNLGKVTDAQLYKGEDGDSDVQQDRLTNTGITGITEKNGLYNIWQVKGFMPIEEGKKKDGKGRWDPKKNSATRYWATFVGNISGDAICVRLIKNPYFHGKSGLKLLHSHEDDSGAYRMGFASILTPLYWQDTTNINQAFDNVTKQNDAFMVADGRVKTRDLTYRQNKLVMIERGVKLEVFRPPDTTGITMAMHDRIQTEGDNITGANKPVSGVVAFSRTSATQAKQTLDQSLLPIDEIAEFISEEMFTWMYEMDAELWRQYSNAEQVRLITQNDIIQRLHPENLWGPLKVKVTAVTRFRNNVVRRQELNSFLQNGYPQAREEMTSSGRKMFWIDTFKEFGFPRSEEYFPMDAEFDATTAAINAVQSFRAGEWVEPLPEQNHDAWLSVLEPYARQYSNLPDSDKDANVQRMFAAHIQIRKDFKDQAKQRVASSSGPQTPQQQGLPGEILGSQIEAEEGRLTT